MHDGSRKHDAFLVLFDLIMHLSAHAARHRECEQVGNAVDQDGDFAQLGDERGCRCNQRGATEALEPQDGACVSSERWWTGSVPTSRSGATVGRPSQWHSACGHSACGHSARGHSACGYQGAVTCDVDDAREALQAVGALDDPVVARVRPHVLRLHQVNASDREREDWAAAPLQAEPDGRAWAPRGRVDAAAGWDHALAADKIFDALVVLVEHRLASPARGEAAGRA